MLIKWGFKVIRPFITQLNTTSPWDSFAYDAVLNYFYYNNTFIVYSHNVSLVKNINSNQKNDSEIQRNRKKILMKIFLQIPHIYTLLTSDQSHTYLINATGTTM